MPNTYPPRKPTTRILLQLAALAMFLLLAFACLASILFLGILAPAFL